MAYRISYQQYKVNRRTLFSVAGRVSARTNLRVGEKQSTQLSKPSRSQRTCFIYLGRP